MTLLPEVELTTDEQKVSYGFGLQFGQQLLNNQFEGMDLDAVLAGVRHWFEQQQAVLTDDGISPCYQVIQGKQSERAAQLAEHHSEEATQFMEENAAREEVTTTETGLQYEVLASGGGASPGPQATVITHYHGTLLDGTVFDSSVERNQPAEFGVHQVISGWTEALQMMSVGDKWRITCPPHLAYGERGAGEAIPPNTTLLFEIELIDIKG